MIWKYFYSTDSAEQHGTLYQLRIRLNWKNVIKNPKSDFNACDDYINLITSNHLVTAALETLIMKSIRDLPGESVLQGADKLWMKTDDERKEVLHNLCGRIVDNFVDFGFHKQINMNGTDKIFQYAQQLMSIGCFYLELSDELKEMVIGCTDAGNT